MAAKKKKASKDPIALLEARAKKGDAGAHHALYLAFGNGDGVDRDDEVAMRHLEEAAKLGLPKAQHDLARETYGQDHARALKLFLQSAKGGSPEGALAAGRMLFHGRHAKRNEKRGLALLKAAAAATDAPEDATNELAIAERRTAAAKRSDEENLQRAIQESGLTSLASRIKKVARPSLRLVTETTKDKAIPIGATKIGGSPDLPRGFAWPLRGETPLAFIAQIRVSDIPKPLRGKLPPKGVLSFFYEAREQPWGNAGEENAWRVELFPDRTKLARVECPDEDAQDVYDACIVHTFEELTIPVARTAVARSIAKTNGDYAAYDALVTKFAHDYRRWPTADGEVHRLFGHPDAIQGDLGRRIAYGLAGVDLDTPTQPLEAEAGRWILLLQIDSDRRANMMWSDLGRIYFMIKDHDLAAGRFDRVFLQLQTG